MYGRSSLKYDQILLMKIGIFVGFRVYSRSYLLCSAVVEVVGNGHGSGIGHCIGKD